MNTKPGVWVEDKATKTAKRAEGAGGKENPAKRRFHRNGLNHSQPTACGRETKDEAKEGKKREWMLGRAEGLTMWDLEMCLAEDLGGRCKITATDHGFLTASSSRVAYQTGIRSGERWHNHAPPFFVATKLGLYFLFCLRATEKEHCLALAAGHTKILFYLRSIGQ